MDKSKQGDNPIVQKASYISNLEALVDFLNFDFDLDDLAEFKEKHGDRFSRCLKTKNTIKEGKKVQAEVYNDLTPILSPTKSIDINEAGWLIQVLVSKINGMGFNPFWSIEPADYESDVSEEGQELLRKEVKKESRNLVPGQRTISILDYKWFFGINDTFWRSNLLWKAAIYAAILEALESGEFPRLKQCRECHKFFVAVPQNRQYCTGECTKEADTKAAATRVKENRKEKREAKQRTSWSATDQKAFDLFFECIQEARVERMDQAVFANRVSMGRLLVRLREQWQEGDSANELWLGLTEGTKNIFREYAKRGVKLTKRSRKARGG